MTKENLVSLNIPAEDHEAILGAINVLDAKLMPHLIEITDEEKSAMPKVKDKSMPFLQKADVYAQQRPNLVPAFVNAAELKRDVQGMEQLKAYSSPLSQIAKALDDTITVAGSEAYIAALAFYKSVKVAASMNVPGAQEIYSDLSKRFEVSTAKASAAKLARETA